MLPANFPSLTRWARFWGVGLWLVSPLSYAASNCDSLREQIDAKIRASGVADFALAVVPSDSRTPGQVVGSCELGARKIVYTRTSQAAAEPRARQERIITECKDGSVVINGSCKR